jgi:hypothetical protein
MRKEDIIKTIENSSIHLVGLWGGLNEITQSPRHSA